MKDETIITITAIAGTVIGLGIAAMNGIDGALTMSGLTFIAGLGGYFLRKRQEE